MEEQPMMHCYFCMTNSWPAEVVDVYEKVLSEYAAHRDFARHALHHGIGHSIWEDENFDDASINASRTYAMQQAQSDTELTAMELFIVFLSFEHLQRIPEPIRVPYTDEEIDDALKSTGSPPPPRGPMKPRPR